ncbi:hypothetical protein CONPUDRAFT_120916 [Coniophora puteana RWD-64-598 SS2]|uniref:DUF6534 domain-containing protein n=1 Tax=Coniophora puteana (strain RWD-64-598) TaxID=741705 RepID=A0A5M3MW15_CONPW|nr:uncharacterized protein CONPUDRAFT_120916 [Coniophora puteana RWD-64-598 SS2]EIW82781.1 hypothetical protein CONPUDRAFT_120916 [Coniophora puteana RWD-64-598 SS2]
MGEYDHTLGLFLVGVFFNTYLYGLVTRQCCAYFTAKFQDRWLVKAMIAFMFLLDSVETIGLIYNLYDWAVTNFTNPSIVTAGNEWPYTTTPFWVGTSAIMTQFFLAWRIWSLSGNRILPAIASMLAVIAWAFCLVSGIKATIIKQPKHLAEINGYVATWMIIQVITDLLIATTLIVILVRSKSGLAKSLNTSIFNRLIGAAIQTGLVAGLFSVIGLTLFVLWPTSNWEAVFIPPIGGIYAITILDTLLARLDVRRYQRLKPRHVSTQVKCM